ncbi:MAG: 30S ribosomal protein S10 [Acholeplasmatales bacterium]|jgi:small subunit ribosomal protein S10|nr:30S ribosomal protein S10 [Acholeplasmatales bacterium]
MANQQKKSPQKDQLNKKEIRLTLRSYDHKLLDKAAKDILDIAARNHVVYSGPVPLPTKKEIFTVLRSPFVNKDSREQFERRTHKRLIILRPKEAVSSAKLTSDLEHMSVPSGVNFDFKV